MSTGCRTAHSTRFGTLKRNLDAETAALQAGLAPGQIRRGLRLLSQAIATFEQFISSLGHDLYFVEPLYYHNAVIFERYGFAYQVGRRLMERIEAGFAPGGDLRPRLDGSTPFRTPAAAHSIRLRSWAIHDGILGEPFTNVTMYKRVGKTAGVSTCPGLRLVASLSTFPQVLLLNFDENRQHVQVEVPPGFCAGENRARLRGHSFVVRTV